MSETLKNVARRRRTKSGEAAPPKQPPEQKSPKKKSRYPLRSRDKPIESVRWVDDDTLFDEEDDDDSTYDGEEEEGEKKEKEPAATTQTIHGITLPSTLPVSVKIHLHARVDEDDEEYEEEYEEEDYPEDYDEDEEDDDEIPHAFIQSLFAGRLAGGNRNQPMFIIGDDSKKKGKDREKKDKDEPALRLSRRESEYFEGLGKQAKKTALKKMQTVSEILGESDVPYKFRILDMNMPIL